MSTSAATETKTKADEAVIVEVAWVGTRSERKAKEVGSGSGGSEWPERFAVRQRVVLSRTTLRALLHLVPVESRTARCTVWHTSVGRGAETRGTVVAIDSKAAYRTLATFVREAAAILTPSPDGGDPNDATLCTTLCVEFDD
jgi:hypothetical protein